MTRQNSPASQGTRVSVILPVRNGQQYIACALDSLAQNCSAEDEVIVVDDHSTDATAAIVQAFTPHFALTVVRSEARGVAAARNKGLSLATGRFITFLDHDDYWPNDRIDTHVKILERHVQTDVVMGTVQVVFDPTVPDLVLPFNTAEPVFSVSLAGSTFRRDIFDAVGYFDESLTYSEDQDLFLRIRESTLHIEGHNSIALYYRIHQTNMTRSRTAGTFQIFDVIRKSIQRRKNSRGFIQMSPFPQN